MPNYTALAAPVRNITEEKNSEFLTFLHPVETRDSAMEWIEHYRKQYADANHVCWAFVIGDTRQPVMQAFNDDGEPSGTAGKPMLHVLTEREVGDSVAIVVRYFGGVKLGAGGLVRAYSAAVSNAVNNAELKKISPKVDLTVKVNFAHETKIRHLTNRYNAQVVAEQYDACVQLQLCVDASLAQLFTQQIINETAGTAEFL